MTELLCGENLIKQWETKNVKWIWELIIYTTTDNTV